ncbi:type VI-B CRISPR-associated RNA-guided ribonuclease Cas13b [Prolixibacteraceae bacterium]|nr:type VI-B CRISPR-associated RNA-guided ribonuclease Cas13b [Prolixibacteraceae bacterium]
MNDKTSRNTSSKKSVLTDKKAKRKYTIYFNLAILHAESAIDEIRQQTALGADDGKRFKTLYSSNMALSDKERLFGAIENYFPILFPIRAFYEKDKRTTESSIHDKVITALDQIFDYLKSYRHQCSHFGYNKDISDQKEGLATLLPFLFGAAILREKNKRVDPVACPYPFSNAQRDDFEMEVAEIRKKYPHMTDMDVREEFLEEQIEFFANHKFDIPKCCNGKRDPKKSLGVEELFLLVQFLDKKKAEELLSQEMGFKNTSTIYYQFTRWAFTTYCFRGLRNKVASHHENIRIPLMMQMIDYLSCVPDALYRHLTEAQKEEFVMDLNDYISPERGEDHKDKLVSHLVVRKRYEDKFPYFAIRFIDEVIRPEGIRFQVYAGNHLKDRREKDIDGKVLSREIKTPIYLFERLSTVCQKKEAMHPSKDDTAKLELFPNPSYHIDKGMIYLAIKGNKKKSSDATKPNDNYYGSSLKNDLRHQLSDPNSQKWHWTPCSISIHDLVAWLFMLLKQPQGKQNGASEACFMSWIHGRSMALNHLIKNPESGAQVGSDEIKGLERDVKCCKTYINLLSWERWKKQHKPTNLSDDIDKKACIKELRSRIADRQQRLTEVEKKKFLPSRIRGERASWTADQLVRWMPKTVRSQWKGYHHRELQALLGAKYFTLGSVNHLYWGVWNTETATTSWRAQLLASFKGTDFITFYRSFLKFEIDQLNLFVQDLDGEVTLKDPLFEYLRPKRFKATSYLNYLKQLQQQVPALPRGLFDDKPTYRSKASGLRIDTDPQAYAEWFVETYRYNKADYQSFYDKLPESIMISSDELKKLRNQDVHKNKSDQELQKKYQYQEMSKIRKEQTKDQAIWWMVKHLLLETTHADNADASTIAELPLRKVYITPSQKADEKKEAQKQSVRAKGDTQENRIKHTSLYRLEIPVDSHSDKKVQLGDLLDYRAKRRNPLIATLQSYDPNRYWDNQALDNELFSGDNSYLTIQRDVIWEKLFEFEEQLLIRYRNKKGYSKSVYPEEFKHNGNPHFKTMLFAFCGDKIDTTFKQSVDAILKDETPTENRTFNPPEKHLLTAILLRNKFAHSQLPSFMQWQKLEEIGAVKHQRNTTYSRSLSTALNTSINRLYKKLT